MTEKVNDIEWKKIALKDALRATSDSCESLLKEFNELQTKVDEDHTLDWFNVSALINRIGSLKISNRFLINLMLKIVADDIEQDMQHANHHH